MNKNKTYNIINKILQNINENNIEDLNNYIEKYDISLNIPIENIIIKNNSIIKNPIKDFFDYHNIYYNKTSNIFYNYLNNNFIVMNQDHILYLISEYMITKCDYISTFNDKITIKNKLLKNIKEISIYEAIPDTETIQNVLHYLCPTIFREKKYCKIFLILLGSIIINKKIENNFIIFTRIQIKSFLEEINKNISIYFCNTNILNYFKFKYTTDHNEITQRKLILSCNNINYDILKNNEQFYINLILVSFYYFNRYKNIDNYINSENITNININQLSNKNIKTDIINEFVNIFIVKGGDQTISEKEIIILWKKFIYDKDLFINTFTSYSDFVVLLFGELNNNYDKNKTNNILYGYYSLETPTINLFKKFWEENFIYCEDEYYLEINEILYLFNKNNKKYNLNEKMIQNIIQNYYNDVNIIDNKIIHNIKCTLWDKKSEIDNFIKTNNITINSNFNDIYIKYSKSNSKHYKISKKYFSKYINSLYL
jgi:hypothetical protein